MMSRVANSFAPALLALASLACREVPATLPVTDPAQAPGAGPAGPAVFVEAPPTGTQGRLTAPMSEEARALYRCWFESPYEYMFSDVGEPRLEVGGRSFAMLMGGISGILYYGDLNECAGRLVDASPRSYSDIRPLELLAGVPATRPDASLPFASVNPEFVWWARQHLLPAPEESIDGVPVQLAYDRVFARFFRVMGESLFYLAETTTLASAADVYLRGASQSRDGIEWLELHYAHIPDHGGSWDGTTMTAAMAAGFWLRRELDGSLPSCWHGLREVFERYDPGWLDELSDRYPSGAATLAALADDMPSAKGSP